MCNLQTEGKISSSYPINFFGTVYFFYRSGLSLDITAATIECAVLCVLFVQTKPGNVRKVLWLTFEKASAAPYVMLKVFASSSASAHAPTHILSINVNLLCVADCGLVLP